MIVDGRIPESFLKVLGGCGVVGWGPLDFKVYLSSLLSSLFSVYEYNIQVTMVKVFKFYQQRCVKVVRQREIKRD